VSWHSIEVAPGITRIESVLGPRPFSQYLLQDHRSLLVDTGVKETPADVILPALDGLRPDFVLISHADVDHFVGNAAIREAAPDAIFCAHEADVPWIEDSELILRERYGWYEAYGIGYPEETFAWLRDAMGPDVPIDLRLRGGEVFRLGVRLAVEILPLPGHSPGHLAFYADLCLFSGDVLFAGSVGRTDLPMADWETLVESIRTLLERFPPETVVYSGHGPPTTLGDELARNPFLAELRA